MGERLTHKWYIKQNSHEKELPLVRHKGQIPLKQVFIVQSWAPAVSLTVLLSSPSIDAVLFLDPIPQTIPHYGIFFLLRCWCPHITCSFASSVAAESPVLLKTKTWLWKEIISSATQCHSMRFVWHVLFSSLTGFICLKVRKGHFYSLYGLYKASCCLPVQQHHQSTTTWLIHSR